MLVELVVHVLENVLDFTLRPVIKHNLSKILILKFSEATLHQLFLHWKNLESMILFILILWIHQLQKHSWELWNCSIILAPLMIKETSLNKDKKWLNSHLILNFRKLCFLQLSLTVSVKFLQSPPALVLQICSYAQNKKLLKPMMPMQNSSTFKVITWQWWTLFTSTKDKTWMLIGVSKTS